MTVTRPAEHQSTIVLAAALREGPLADVRASLPAGAQVWAVGGTVRDLLLGRGLTDIDLAVAGDARTVAKAIHDALGGDIFSLSDRFGTWRVLLPQCGVGVDVTELRATTIEDDLLLRDFTINAMAIAMGPGVGGAPGADGEPGVDGAPGADSAHGVGGVPSVIDTPGTPGAPALIDPLDGTGDIERRVMRIAGDRAYNDDPLRPLRLARIAAAIGFSIEPATSELTKQHAAAVSDASAERIFTELRLLVAAADPLPGLRLLDELGLMQSVLPELSGLQGVEQSDYHHLDAYEHTLAVLAELVALEGDLGRVFGDDAAAVGEQLAEPLSEGMTRGEALRWGALLHDIAKRETRVVHPSGHVGFPMHDRRGAEIAREICRRLRASDRFTQYVCALTREHLRLGFLVSERPLSRRQVYAYLSACEPVEVEVGVLSAADRLATRGRKAEIAIERHLGLVRELGAEALAWRAAKPVEPLLRGDRLASELGIQTGPALGELLAAIAEARFAGEIETPAQAIELARGLL